MTDTNELLAQLGRLAIEGAEGLYHSTVRLIDQHKRYREALELILKAAGDDPRFAYFATIAREGLAEGEKHETQIPTKETH